MLIAKIIIALLVFLIVILCGMVYQQEKRLIEIDRFMKGLEEIGKEKNKEKEVKTVTLHSQN